MNDEQLSGEEKSLKKFLNASVMIILVILMFIAAFTFFFSMQTAIHDLFDPRYQSLMLSIFSLIVLGAVIYLVKMFFKK